MVNGPRGAHGMPAAGLADAAPKSRRDDVQIPHQGEVGRNAKERTSRQRVAMALTVERAGRLGQNGANAVRHAHQGLKSGLGHVNILLLV